MRRSLHAANFWIAAVGVALCAALALGSTGSWSQGRGMGPDPADCVMRGPGVGERASQREHDAVLQAVVPRAILQREVADRQNLPLADAKHSPPARRLRLSEWRITGRAIDLDGAPVGGIAVTVEAASGRESQARSGADGRFSFSVAAQSARLFSTAADYVAVAATRVRQGVEATLVVAPAFPLSLEVLDVDTGLPVRAASVAPRPSARLKDRLGALAREIPDLGSSAGLGAMALRVNTDAQGVAYLPRLCRGDWWELEVARPGYAPVILVPEAGDESWLQARLRPLSPDVRLTGIVTSQDGEPVAFAEVRHGDAAVRTDRAGAFELRLEAEPTKPLKVLHPRAGLAMVDPAQAMSGPCAVILVPEVSESKADAQY